MNLQSQMFELINRANRWAHLHPHNRNPDLSPFPQFLIPNRRAPARLCRSYKANHQRKPNNSWRMDSNSGPMVGFPLRIISNFLHRLCAISLEL